MDHVEQHVELPPAEQPWAPPRAVPGAPLTLGQVRVLLALAVLCEPLGSEAELPAISTQAGMRRGAVAQSLQGLERRGCVTGHEHDGPTAWSLTLTGRSRATDLAASVRF